MGFGKKGKNSFTVHRSEEVLPGDITRELRAGGGAGGGGAGGGLSRGSSSEADPIEHFFGDGAGGERCAQSNLLSLSIFLFLCHSVSLSICLRTFYLAISLLYAMLYKYEFMVFFSIFDFVYSIWFLLPFAEYEAENEAQMKMMINISQTTGNSKK